MMDVETYNQQKIIENLAKDDCFQYWFTLCDMRGEERDRLLRNLIQMAEYFTLTPEMKRVKRDLEEGNV